GDNADDERSLGGDPVQHQCSPPRIQMGYRVSRLRCTLTDPNGVHSVQGPVGAPLPSATAALTHSTHAHSAWAVAAQASRHSTAITEAGRSRIMACLLSRTAEGLPHVSSPLRHSHSD